MCVTARVKRKIVTKTGMWVGGLEGHVSRENETKTRTLSFDRFYRQFVSSGIYVALSRESAARRMRRPCLLRGVPCLLHGEGFTVGSHSYPNDTHVCTCN